MKESSRMLLNTGKTLMQFAGDYAARVETFRKQLDEVCCAIWCNKETQNSEAEIKEGFEVFSEKLHSPEGRFFKDRTLLHRYYLEIEQHIIHENYSFDQLEDNLFLLENFEDHLAITQPVVKICINDSWSVSIDNTIDNVFKSLTLAAVTLEELSPGGEILSRQILTLENLINIPKPRLRE